MIDKANTPAHVLPIFIVKELANQNKAGVTNTEQEYCFANNLGHAEKIAAHEVGHYFNLSTKGKGVEKQHDPGPWPQELADQGAAWTGLMYPENALTCLKWLRQEDWIEANKKAKVKTAQ